VFQEYYFARAASPFNPYLAAPLALDFTIEIVKNKASYSFTYIEIIFEHGSETLSSLKPITAELTYNLIRQSTTALSTLPLDIKPGNMIYDGGKDLLKITEMGSVFGCSNKKKGAMVSLEGKVGSCTFGFVPHEVLLMARSVANNPNLGLSLPSIHSSL